MHKFSFSEENYIKWIYRLSNDGRESVNTNSLAVNMKTRPASVTDMIQKLAEKKVVHYEKYKGVYITEKGKNVALGIIRKHRLWEVFLVDKLKFNWDQVHEIAEQLEHIRSPLLTSRLDEFLGYPKYDPHGDPIPDEKGTMKARPRKQLSFMEPGESGTLVTVSDSSELFLRYLDKMGISIGSRIKVIDKIAYDGSMEVQVNNKRNITVSFSASNNLLLTS
ncbi:MAG TPA: metal-dependent transcriptional regulator [Cyclobacteriaceae bacterium]|nr:metal-dependent transcriptional regulator [Cyclobacteriaceae bacterium]